MPPVPRNRDRQTDTDHRASVVCFHAANRIKIFLLQTTGKDLFVGPIPTLMKAILSSFIFFNTTCNFVFLMPVRLSVKELTFSVIHSQRLLLLYWKVESSQSTAKSHASTCKISSFEISTMIPRLSNVFIVKSKILLLLQ